MNPRIRIAAAAVIALLAVAPAAEAKAKPSPAPKHKPVKAPKKAKPVKAKTAPVEEEPAACADLRTSRDAMEASPTYGGPYSGGDPDGWEQYSYEQWRRGSIWVFNRDMAEDGCADAHPYDPSGPGEPVRVDNTP